MEIHEATLNLVFLGIASKDIESAVKREATTNRHQNLIATLDYSTSISLMEKRTALASKLNSLATTGIFPAYV